VPRFVRFRPVEEEEWRAPLDQTGDHPMTLLDMERGTREDLWPGKEHVGLPVLLPGGEEGRLISFAHSDDGRRWDWIVEFRGERKG
jgi:hypothetical protein